MKNAVLSQLFDQMADIMEILGEDRFRINTYRKVGRIIGDTPVDVEVLLATGQLAEIPGIGKSSLAKNCLEKSRQPYWNCSPYRVWGRKA